MKTMKCCYCHEQLPVTAFRPSRVRQGRGPCRKCDALVNPRALRDSKRPRVVAWR